MTPWNLSHRLHGELPFYTVEAHGLTIYEQGAHVASWHRPNGDPVFFMSQSSHFEPGKPIRGGIPLVFPWFGPRADDPAAPAHGFARTRDWFFEGFSQDGSSSTVEFSLASDEATKAIWPHDFEARYSMTAVPDELKFHFSVRNTGSQPVRFEAVLHTYFVVQDVREIEIEGLEGSEYLDKLSGQSIRQQGRIRFTEETDRVYNATSGNFIIHDPGLRRRILINTDSPSTVVWNPWVAKAQRLPDFGDEEWPGMVCVESGVIGDDRRDVPPGEELSFTVIYKVRDI